MIVVAAVILTLGLMLASNNHRANDIALTIIAYGIILGLICGLGIILLISFA